MRNLRFFASLRMTETMLEDETPRQLAERTGKHLCVKCLAEVDSEEYLRNDHLCDACAENEMQSEEK